MQQVRPEVGKSKLPNVWNERQIAGMVWCGMFWYGSVHYGMLWYGIIQWYGMVWYGIHGICCEHLSANTSASTNQPYMVLPETIGTLRFAGIESFIMTCFC